MSILLISPAVEPVALAEPKTHLRIQHDDDDDEITALIAGARVHIETQTRRALTTQSWTLTRDVWPVDALTRQNFFYGAEVSLPPWWRRRLAYAFKFPGVEN